MNRTRRADALGDPCLRFFKVELDAGRVVESTGSDASSEPLAAASHTGSGSGIVSPSESESESESESMSESVSPSASPPLDDGELPEQPTSTMASQARAIRLTIRIASTSNVLDRLILGGT